MALPPVPGAVRNATDWYLYLANTLKVPPANRTLLKNNEATVEKLRKFAARAAAQVKPGGTLWLVFIGHGAPAKDGADGVVVGFDAQQDPDSLYARSLSQTELLSILGKDAQARTVANIDACFSGRSAAGPLVPGLQPVIALRPLEATGSRVVLTAWSGDQFAGPLPWPPDVWAEWCGRCAQGRAEEVAVRALIEITSPTSVASLRSSTRRETSPASPIIRASLLSLFSLRSCTFVNRAWL